MMSKGEAGLSRKIIFNMWVSAAVYNFLTDFLVCFPLPCCECSSLSFAFKESLVLVWAQGVSLWPAAVSSCLPRCCTQVSGFGCISGVGWGPGLSLYCMWPHGLAIRFCCTSHGGFVGWKATHRQQMCPILLFQHRVMGGICGPDARETGHAISTRCSYTLVIVAGPSPRRTRLLLCFTCAGNGSKQTHGVISSRIWAAILGNKFFH